MDIILCDESHGAAWDTFLANSEHATLYHLWDWRALNAACFGHRSFYLAAVEDERVVGVLPFVRLKSPVFGDLGCSMPFVNFGGPVATSPDVAADLLAEAAHVVHREGLDYLEIRSTRHLGDAFPAATHKVSMTLDLAPDAELLWNRFKTGHRQEIRRGYKQDLSARHGGAELLDEFFALLSESWRDHGTPIYRRSYFARVLRTFSGNVWICVVYKGQEPVAAAMQGHYHGVAEGMWLGIPERHKRLLAGYVLYWEVIQHACSLGLTRYHLGRSTADSGAEAFKKKWNAYATQLYWHYVLRQPGPLPGLNVSNPKYQLAIDLWRRLPVNLTQVLGPLIARAIP